MDKASVSCERRRAAIDVVIVPMLIAMSLLLAMPFAQAAGSDPRDISVAGKPYAQLRGRRLRTMIDGHSFHVLACQDTTGCLEDFKPNGVDYIARGDIPPLIPGTYEISHDKVCVSFHKVADCRVFFAGPDGTFASLPAIPSGDQAVVYERDPGGAIGDYLIPKALRRKH